MESLQTLTTQNSPDLEDRHGDLNIPLEGTETQRDTAEKLSLSFDLKGNSGGRVARHPFSRRVTSALLRLIGRSMPVICLSEMIGWL